MNIILLSGGSGKRLWPLSNDIRSKQFIKIFKKEDGTYESMVQRVYPMMRELLIFIRETVCLCRRIQKSLRFTDRRSSLISEDKIQNSRVWGKTGR